jgi:hypothetical protein
MKLQRFALPVRSLCAISALWVVAQENAQPRPRDTVADAQDLKHAPQHSQPAQMRRPEQDKTEHDSSDIFLAPNAKPSSPVFKGQAKEGKNAGFDFYRDPLDAEMPNQSPDAIMKQLETDRPKVIDAQRKLLEGRYDLTPKLDPKARMSRDKPIAVGPTARLKGTVSWDRLSEMTTEEIKQEDLFPYPRCPIPCRPTEARSFRRSRFSNFRGLSALTLILICPRLSFLNFPRPYF